MIMLTPRSYMFSRQPSSQISSSKRPKNGNTKPEPKHKPLPKPAPRETNTPTTAEQLSRPTTPSSPVVIPLRNNGRENPHIQKIEARSGRPKNVTKPTSKPEQSTRPSHSSKNIRPSVAALLATTTIPRSKHNNGGRRKSGAEPRLTVAAIVDHKDDSEKDFSMSLGRSPLDVLLTPPEELEEDDLLDAEPGRASIASARTLSSESMPSLDASSMSSSSLSLNSMATPSPRGRRPLPTRRLHSLSSPSPGDNMAEDHPLRISKSDIDLDELDFRVFAKSQENDEQDTEVELQLPKARSAFKSNLTASLRALKSAARTLSSLKPPLMTPDDFLTRSIITIDPAVPFTDERMPPTLEETPTPALRRYLNPITNAPIEAHVPSSLAQMSTTKCTASIQMQTYKISRSGKSPPPIIISRRTLPTAEEVFADVSAGPVARQRDMRENSDFIRIAVMEMAMRKNGKLDDQKPGRARWALPPRKPATKPYEIGANGVPTRWIAVTL